MKRWQKNLHKANFTPTKNTRICSLHFTEADFQAERADKNACRKRSRGELLQRRYLTSTAEPTIFVDLPTDLRKNKQNLRKATPAGRSGRRASSYKRRRVEVEEKRHEEVVAELHKSDNILTDVSELESHLKVECVPSGFTLVPTGNLLNLCYVVLGAVV